MQRVPKETSVIWSVNIIAYFIRWNSSDSCEIFQTFLSRKTHGDWPGFYKTISQKVSVIEYVYQRFNESKSNGRLLGELDVFIQFT